jgi:hypothetical protein
MPSRTGRLAAASPLRRLRRRRVVRRVAAAMIVVGTALAAWAGLTVY